MKLDLEKVYDKVDWIFLRLALLQIGLRLEIVNWIIVCVSLGNFVVLINGYPSWFFKGSQGLRKDFIFLLVAVSLCKFLMDASDDGSLKGMLVADSVRMTHLVFWMTCYY